jgi:predicted DNA-binding protein
MALIVPPELEQRVTALAQKTSRDPQELLTDLLDEALAEDDDFIAFARQRWADGDAAVARGEYFEGTPGDIMARIRAKATSSA